jgi:hypothetical protein
MLDAGEESVSSALRHARANLHSRLPPPTDPAPAPDSAAERAIVEQLVTAYEAGDVAALVALLTDDAVLTAPLAAGAFVGPAAASRAFEAIFAQDRSYRLIDTRANGQPAFGIYVRDPATGVFHANGMLVVTLAGDRIRAMTRFDNSVIAKFGLPRRLYQPARRRRHALCPADLLRPERGGRRRREVTPRGTPHRDPGPDAGARRAGGEPSAATRPGCADRAVLGRG